MVDSFVGLVSDEGKDTEIHQRRWAVIVEQQLDIFPRDNPIGRAVLRFLVRAIRDVRFQPSIPKTVATTRQKLTIKLIDLNK